MEQFFVDLLERFEDMHKFYHQHFDSLTTEQLDWVPGQDMNSLCVLAVHVTQAERYWVGLALDDPIQRNRPAEFTASGYTSAELKARFSSNIDYYKQVFVNATVNTFAENVTIAMNPQQLRECTRAWALLHALDHTAEHLGHAGMTRQLLNQHFGS
jgi:hypothetical protein